MFSPLKNEFKCRQWKWDVLIATWHPQLHFITQPRGDAAGRITGKEPWERCQTDHEQHQLHVTLGGDDSHRITEGFGVEGTIQAYFLSPLPDPGQPQVITAGQEAESPEISW